MNFPTKAGELVKRMATRVMHDSYFIPAHPEDNQADYQEAKRLVEIEQAVPTGGRPTLPKELVQLCEKWEAEERRCQEIIANPASGWSQMIEQERARTLRECIDATRRLPAPPVPAASVTPAVEREALELVRELVESNRKDDPTEYFGRCCEAMPEGWLTKARRLVAAAADAGREGGGK